MATGTRDAPDHSTRDVTSNPANKLGSLIVGHVKPTPHDRRIPVAFGSSNAACTERDARNEDPTWERSQGQPELRRTTGELRRLSYGCFIIAAKALRAAVCSRLARRQSASLQNRSRSGECRATSAGSWGSGQPSRRCDSSSPSCRSSSTRRQAPRFASGLDHVGVHRRDMARVTRDRHACC
jgi:hypothetical protein